METITSQPKGQASSTSSHSSKAFQLVDESSVWGNRFWRLAFDLPGEKVNKFSTTVMEEYENLLDELEMKGKAGEIEGLVVTSPKPGIFIAGADIKLIQSAKNAEEAEALAAKGQALLNRWEELPFPRVVAINGACLGGGCELSLASSAIVMSDDRAAKIGLPEVMLGFVPGMGGCVRLPQKVGLATAFDMILTGKQLDGQRAYKAGLADACLPKQNFEHGVFGWMQKNLSKLTAKVYKGHLVGAGHGPQVGRAPKLGGMGGAMGSMLEGTPPGRGMIFSKAREGVMKKTRGHYPAPLAAIDVIKNSGSRYRCQWTTKHRDAALAMEAKAFGKCASTDISKNLVRLFFLTEDVKKSNGLPAGNSVSVDKVQTAGVLGAGVMGGGIAQLFADKGIRTRMKDINTDALALGVQAANAIWNKKVKRRRLSKRDALQKLNLISPSLDFSGFRSTQVVVEAIVENMDIKKKVLAETEGHAGSHTVMATNTSSLSVTEMQGALSRPENFVGMHFFNPVHRMPLVEVIRGSKSSDEAVATIYELSKQLGKIPIVTKDDAGFLVNRLLGPYLNEASYLVGEGAPIPELDEALLDFGMPMGPMELIDEVGIDVGAKVAKILNEAFGARMTPAAETPKLVEAGHLGKKNTKGLYRYDKGGRNKRFESSIYEVLGVQPQPGKLSREEMVDRCVLPMINEAARCLEEQVVVDAATVDLGMIMGTGFPPFRGGLLRYADSLGVGECVKRLEKYAEKLGGNGGERFQPSAALLERVKGNRPFYQD